MTEDNTTPDEPFAATEFTDEELTDLLAQLGLNAPRPPQVDPDEALSVKSAIYVDAKDGSQVPIEFEITYPRGRTYEAAQALAALGSPISLSTFVLGEALNTEDNRVFEDLSALGYTPDTAEDRVMALFDGFASVENDPNVGASQDPYAGFRGSVQDVVDIASL